MERMVPWLSVAELARELDLKASPEDRDAVRSEIRREMAAVHSDRKGGEFSNPAQQSRYQRLAAALEYLDRPPTTALVSSPYSSGSSPSCSLLAVALR
jgi:hypothetical protein